MEEHRGAKYERGLDVVEIAKRIRKDLRTAIRFNTLPKGTKSSVRVSRYSMGCSIDVEIKTLPGVNVLNPERVRDQVNNPHDFSRRGGLYSDEGRAALKTVEEIVAAYNFSMSEFETDYCNTNFHYRVKFAWSLEEGCRAEILRTLEPQKPARPPGRAKHLRLVCDNTAKRHEVAVEHTAVVRCGLCGRTTAIALGLAQAIACFGCGTTIPLGEP